jgi:yecA family protein
MPIITDADFSFPDEKSAVKFFRFLFSLSNETLSEISKPFENPDDIYTPCCIKEDHERKADCVLWANGFMAAVTSFRENFEPLNKNKETKSLILPMVAIAGQNHPDENLRTDPISDKKYDKITSLMFAHINLIYHFLRGQKEGLDISPDSPIQPINKNVH